MCRSGIIKIEEWWDEKGPLPPTYSKMLNKIKTVKVSEDDWKILMKYKIDIGMRSIPEVINMLILSYENKKKDLKNK